MIDINIDRKADLKFELSIIMYGRLSDKFYSYAHRDRKLKLLFRKFQGTQLIVCLLCSLFTSSFLRMSVRQVIFSAST